MTASDPVNAPYSIDSTSPSSWVFVTTNTPFAAYFLSGTVVNLYYPNWNNTATNIQASQVLAQNSSWVFSGGLWRNAPVPVTQPSIVQNFYANLPNPNSLMYPTNVYNDMMAYMSDYVGYAASGFSHGSPYYSQLNAVQGTLTNNLQSIVQGH